MPFTQFTCFNRLPTEIRLSIWQFALPCRILWLDSSLEFIRQGNHRPPPVNYVCHESRAVVTMHSIVLKLDGLPKAITPNGPWYTYFNPTTDSLFLQMDSNGNRYHDATRKISYLRYHLEVLYMRLPFEICFKIPSFLLDDIHDGEVFITMRKAFNQVYRSRPYSVSDWFFWIPTTWKFPETIKAELFPHESTILMIDIFDSDKLVRLRTLYEEIRPKSRHLAHFKSATLDMLLHQSTRDRILRQKMEMLYLNWAFITRELSLHNTSSEIPQMDQLPEFRYTVVVQRLKEESAGTWNVSSEAFNHPL
ncbi:hypothetical protein BX600DRAFT_526035 [Xylariales sp. PMI_506]|nr:hypothetical protein BX600DRAFT_526035 [Xylariales sp. PMI_506]